MTVGAPGAGIGGLFYLASALVLPFRSLLRAWRGEQVHWRSVMRQAGLALAVLAAIWLAGWVIGLWAGPGLVVTPRTGIVGHIVRSTGVLGTAMLYVSVGTLLLVLVLVQLAALVVRRPSVTRVHPRPGSPV
jgi:hypothetical protein